MLFTQRFLFCLSAGCAVFALRWLSPSLAWLGWAYDAVLLFLIILDYRLTPSSAQLSARRHICGTGLFAAEKLSLGVDNRIVLQLRNHSPLRLKLIVKDDPPPEFAVTPRTLTTDIGGSAEVTLTYVVRPPHRGNFCFGDIHLRCFSVLGFFLRQKRVAASQPVRVYPNLMEVRKHDLLARRGRLRELGMRASLLRGRGTEFESLREYHPDDEFRHIHWKATARRGKLISSQYQVERSQNILILLDCGRMMATEASPSDPSSGMSLTKLDCAINATLMLSYMATLMDDKVGLLTFSDDIREYLPPRKGRRQVYRIMESLYSLGSDFVESDYNTAFRYLMTRSQKRTLVLLFTELVDKEVSQEMLTHLAAMHPAHLPLCVTIASGDIVQMAVALPRDSQQAYEKAIALHVLRQRQQALEVLRSRGVGVVDVPPEGLSVAVINKYLELKARTLL